MQKYPNKSGNSGVTYYRIGKHFIDVMFKNKEGIYQYNNAKIGKKHIDKMKELATTGKGLSTYISQHPEVRDNYILL